MQPAVFSLTSMIVTGSMLAAILLIAWGSFGRPAHALTWAAAYGVAVLEWSVSLSCWLGLVAMPVARPIVVSLGGVSAALLLAGFRQRARLQLHLGVLIAATFAAVASAASVSVVALNGPADRAIMPAFFAFTKLLSALTLVGRGDRPGPIDRVALAVLTLCAAYGFGLAGLAFVQGPASAADIAVYRTMMLFGTPTAFTGAGLVAVFLLAADLADRMRRLAILDPLTNILNRRGFEQAAEAAIANAGRTGQPLCLVVADLDRFKSINDTHGHPAGDRVLRRFAGHAESAIRKGDLFGRIGGEEFAIMLINTPWAAAAEVTDRLREGVERLPTGVDGLALTASFGVASLRTGERSLAELMARADAALYRSKLDGRNRVSLAEEPEVEPMPPSLAVAARSARRAERRRPVPHR